MTPTSRVSGRSSTARKPTYSTKTSSSEKLPRRRNTKSIGSSRKKVNNTESNVKSNRNAGKDAEKKTVSLLKNWFTKLGIECDVRVLPHNRTVKQPIDIQVLGDVLFGIECKLRRDVLRVENEQYIINFLVKDLSGTVSRSSKRRQVEDQQIYIDSCKLIGLYCVVTKLDESQTEYNYIFFPHIILHEAYKNNVVRMELSTETDSIYVWKPRKDNREFIDFIRRNFPKHLLDNPRFHVP